MAKNNNLTDFLTDVADAIREREGTTEKINPQDFSNKILSLATGGGSDAGKVLKITNKLNGASFGGSDYYYKDGYNALDVLHTYNFEGGQPTSFALIPINKDETFPFEGIIDSPYPDFDSVRLRQNMSGDYYYSDFDIRLKFDGELGVFETGDDAGASIYPTRVNVIVFDNDGNYDIDYFYIQCAAGCFTKDTPITLINKETKLIQDINYNDELLVWDFDNGCYSSAKPLWIKRNEITNHFYRVVFENGITLNLVGDNGKCHRVYSITKNRFEYAVDCIGDDVFTEKGVTKLLSCNRINEKCEYYNIITKYHMNMFAYGVLTSCRYNNIYEIDNMQFVKDDRLKGKQKWEIYEEKFKNYQGLGNYLDGLRLYEQKDIPIEDTLSYIENLKLKKKELADFKENYELVYSIEDANVGWIDPEGNVYGFRLYMPGQHNHIILAKKICKERGYIEERYGEYSRTLENKGWIKFSNEFLSSAQNVNITDRQQYKLARFMATNNKVKHRGTIKLGTIFSNSYSLDYVNMMPKTDFDKKIKGGT